MSDHDQTTAPAPRPGDLAEQAGAVIGHELLNGMMRTTTQAEALRLLHAALLDLDHPRTSGGFAVVLVDVLMRGLRNLPRMPIEADAE